MSSEAAAVDRTIRALADPTRREILRALRAGPLTAGEIGSHFPLTAASVSHHLGVLEQANLLQRSKRGRWVFYEVTDSPVLDLLRSLAP